MPVEVYSAFGQTGGTSVALDTTSYTRGMQFTVSQQASLTGIWFYSPQGATSLPNSAGIFVAGSPSAGNGQLLCQISGPNWSGTSGSGWIKTAFDGKLTLFPGVNYKVCVQNNGGADWYSVTSSFFNTGNPGAGGWTTGVVTVAGTAGADGGFQDSSVNPSTGSVLTYPNLTAAGGNLWVDVEVTTGIPAPTPPVTGFALQSPRSWSTEDLVTTPRLRAAMYNVAALNNQARPLLLTSANGNGGANAVVITTNSAYLNSWDTIFSLQTQPGQVYQVPLPGWYLIQGQLGVAPQSGVGSATTLFSWGVQWTQGATSQFVRTDLAGVTGFSSAGTVYSGLGQSGMELILLNSNSGDLVTTYGFTNHSTGSATNGYWSLEWIGLPGTTSINGNNYAGPVGTVVSNPKPASLWPQGAGVALAGSVAAGGTTLAIAGGVPGLRAGGLIGVDWQNGIQSQAYGETTTVSSVAGTVVTVNPALLYGHAAGAPVAVPVSAAFLNEQLRDQDNFQFFPPMLRAVQGTASPQSIPTATWTTVNLALNAGVHTNTIDNFNGFASNTYTIPVSGLYLCMGQVYFAGSATAANWGAAILAGGTLYWGDYFRSATGSSNGEVPAVRYLLRLVQGQTVQLQCNQNTGGNISLNPKITTNGISLFESLPRLIVIWRGF